jgi:hypothetical protein
MTREPKEKLKPAAQKREVKGFKSWSDFLIGLELNLGKLSILENSFKHIAKGPSRFSGYSNFSL